MRQPVDRLPPVRPAVPPAARHPRNRGLRAAGERVPRGAGDRRRLGSPVHFLPVVDLSLHRSMGRPITAETNPWVYRTVEETARQAGVPTPKIWESGDDSPNAFVFGRTISSAELVITQGLLERLNQDEIRAVLAHEIGHLRHRDVII